ncbi:MAG: hypothetical protein ABSG71_03550 [Thermodesulfobacteriota bacterium]|jgi:hypothetical protein
MVHYNENLDKTSNNDILPVGIASKRRPMSKICSSHNRNLLKKQLLEESSMVAYDSSGVLEEFEKLEEEFPLNDLSRQNHEK